VLGTKAHNLMDAGHSPVGEFWLTLHLLLLFTPIHSFLTHPRSLCGFSLNSYLR